MEYTYYKKSADPDSEAEKMVFRKKFCHSYLFFYRSGLTTADSTLQATSKGLTLAVRGFLPWR